MKPLKIGGIVTAAGDSKRMGFHKALLPIFGKTALSYSLKQLSCIIPEKLYTTLCAPLIFNQALREDLAHLGALVMGNAYPEQGYAGSIRTILEVSPKDLDGIIVTPVDSPILSHQLLVTMINCASSLYQEPCIIAPHFFASPGHPIYLSKHFFGEITSERLSDGMRTLITNHRNNVHAVFSADDNVLLNLNSYSDITKYRLNR